MFVEKLRNSTWVGVAGLVVMFITYVSAYFLSDVDSCESFMLHGIKWFLYYACILYLPFVCMASCAVYLFVSNDAFPCKKVLYCSINMILTVIIAIISFKNHFMIDSYIALIVFSLEMWIIAFIDDRDKYDILFKRDDSTFLISKPTIKRYNNLFDYNTGKTLLHGDLSTIKHFHSTPELHYAVNNGMQSLLSRLSNGDYLLTNNDKKQVKTALLTMYGGYDDDPYYRYEKEIFDLIKAIYLLDRTETH